VRHRLGLIALLGCLTLGAATRADDQRSLAVTDPLALRVLDGDADGGFGLARLLAPTRHAAVTNDALFALPAMAPILAALNNEVAAYSSGLGPGHDTQLFDASVLTSPDHRFVLAGIVNRMDRAYVAPDTCGEIRLIYRLVRISAGPAPPRLPMTLNLVLRAKEPAQASPSCADLAGRWLASTALAETGPQLAERLRASDGPLASIAAADIDRIETNLQIGHVPTSERHPFRTDYLQNVFRYDRASAMFREAPMENQIDGGRLLADATLGRAFKAWLLSPDNLAALDRGTILVPERYLATSSLAATPAGLTPSQPQPSFADRDIVAALQRATAHGISLQNIRSPTGFARRLNDITCGGCHQIRGIGGFHFPGVDWLAETPSNARTVPMSPHFAGDQARRRDIVMAMRDGRAADFSRGFSDRPQTRGSAVYAGTSLLDGWGATCYRGGAKRAVDRSFVGWTCAKGLACQQVDAESEIGMCFVK
jgi:hypothetical protein